MYALPSSSSPDLTQSASHPDRTTGLQVFGVIQIIMGSLAAFGIPMMLLGAAISRKATGTTMPIGTYLLTAVTYGTCAFVLITLGVGSIRTRRWARTLTLILSWIWLVMGVLVTILITAILPSAFASGFRRAAAINPNAGQVPAGFMAVILTFIIVLFALLFVVLPLAFALFYRRQDVEETCRRRDPVERWTDRCPLPVLAASLIFTFGAFYYLFMSFTAPIIPFFGKWLTGVPGAIACIVMAIIDIYLAVLLFRRQIMGWWLAVSWLSVRAVSMIVTLARDNVFQAYARMGWKQAQLDAIQRNPVLRGHVILWWSVAYVLLFVGYTLWLKRYFQPTHSALPLENFAPPPEHHEFL